jgi:hypothetical protein
VQVRFVVLPVAVQAGRQSQFLRAFLRKRGVSSDDLEGLE